MGGGLLGLTNPENKLTAKNLEHVFWNDGLPEKDLVLIIENIKKSYGVSYIMGLGETLFLTSCRNNKSIVAMMLLETYDSAASTKSDFFVRLFEHKDISRKTALNYAISNNMKQVALKILELKKKYKQVDNIVKHMFGGPWKYKKNKITPFESKFVEEQSNNGLENVIKNIHDISDFDNIINKAKMIPFEFTNSLQTDNNNMNSVGNIYSFSLDPKDHQPSGTYHKLNEKGYIPEETVLNNGDVIFGKVTPLASYKDSSEIYKYSSKHGQIGTIGILLDSVDMPFNKDGVKPDIILNPSYNYK